MTDERIDRSSEEAVRPPYRPGFVITALGIFFVALNLRPAINSVGFVLPQIRSDLALGAAAGGMLTTVPLLAFVVFSMQVPGWGRRFGMGRLLFISMLLLALGIAIRAIPNAAMLYAGMAVIGLAIAIGNVLLPAYIKARFPEHISVLMGIYTVCLSLGPALAAALTLPVAQATGSWSVALISWGILTLIAIPLWLPQLRGTKTTDRRVTAKTGGFTYLWRSPLAWSVAIYFAIMSVLFYTVNSWLPTILADRGSSVELGSTILTVVNFTALPFTLTVSILVNRTRTQSWATVTGSSLFLIGIAGIFYGPEGSWLLFSLVLGVGLGTVTGVAFSLAVLRARNADATAALTGMSQTAGYCLSALGPVGAGAIREFTGSWEPVIWLFLGFLAVQAVVGFFAGRDRSVDKPDKTISHTASKVRR